MDLSAVFTEYVTVSLVHPGIIIMSVSVLVVRIGLGVL